jgi:uncharacterized membrane protein
MDPTTVAAITAAWVIVGGVFVIAVLAVWSALR